MPSIFPGQNVIVRDSQDVIGVGSIQEIQLMGEESVYAVDIKIKFVNGKTESYSVRSLEDAVNNRFIANTRNRLGNYVTIQKF